MKRELLRTSRFVKQFSRLTKRYPETVEVLRDVLVQLTEDVFHPTLRTHKLKGEMAGLWSCRAGYDLRIVFEFVESDGKEAILLQSVGTHDEVY